MSAKTSKSDHNDAATRFTKIADDVRSAALDVMWLQWHALGAHTTAHARAKSIVDPEALVLASLLLRKDEPRLGDILHDWAVHNSALLSVQRAKNLLGDYAPAVREQLALELAWFARVAFEHKDLRWQSILEKAGEPYANNSRMTPALRHNKPRATNVNASEPPALMLRLRLAFGVGIKADLISFLLGTREWANARDIVEATGYTAAAVRRAADELATADFIGMLDRPPINYHIDAERWRALLNVRDRPPSWRNWRGLFAFIGDCLSWASELARRDVDDYAFGAKARELLERHPRVLEGAGVTITAERSRSVDWSAFGEDAIALVTSHMTQVV